jgi:phosphotransferase system IIA component
VTVASFTRSARPEFRVCVLGDGRTISPANHNITAPVHNPIKNDDNIILSIGDGRIIL